MIDPKLYILSPLSESEIVDIEKQMDRKIPAQLRELLSVVGFLQNAIGGDWPGNAGEFVRTQIDIPDNHVAFMGDGAGNYYVTSPANRVLFWDHETRKATDTGSDLATFIEDYVCEPEPLDDLVWHVQMSFKVIEDQPVLDLLAQHFGFRFSGDWQFKDKSPAGVFTYLLHYQADKDKSCISKQKYDSWPTDIIYCNMVIAISNIPQYRLIFSEFESDHSVAFSLCDYGILPADVANES